MMIIMKEELNNLERIPDHIVLEMIRVALLHNLDPEPLLQEIGIDIEKHKTGVSIVSRENAAHLLNILCRELGDETGGFAGAPIPIGARLMMARLTVNEPTLRDALHLGFNFYHMITKAFEAQLTEEDGLATIELKPIPTPPEHDPYHMFVELLLMSWHRYSGFLIGENIPLNDIFFDYDVPIHANTYSVIFPGNLIFNHPKLGFSFPSSYLDMKVVQDSRSTKEFMINAPLSYIEYFKEETLSASIIRQIRPLLRTGLPSLETVADNLNISKRTLTRKLKQECTSYQRLKDTVRREEAICLLIENKLPIKKIAELIQFSDPAVFSRAFLSWTGSSPCEFRDKANGGPQHRCNR